MVSDQSINYNNLINSLGEFKVITLCGSTKFKSSFDAMNLNLTLNESE